MTKVHQKGQIYIYLGYFTTKNLLNKMSQIVRVLRVHLRRQPRGGGGKPNI